MNMHVTEQHDAATTPTESEASVLKTLGAIAEEMRAMEALMPDTSTMPERLKASDLHETELFQVRAGISSYHVESLARAIDHDGDLKPVLVFRRGGRAFLIDGWHRKRAYELARRGDSIPVIEFHGTPQDALLEGQRLNKLHTLAMTKDERMDCAWKLVKLDASKVSRFTLKQIMAVGVSRGQVTLMRRVLRDLGEEGAEHNRWKEAMRAHSKQPDRQYTDEEIEDMHASEAAGYADKMARFMGTRASDKPEVLARTIEIYAGRRTPEVIRILIERNETEDDDFDIENREF